MTQDEEFQRAHDYGEKVVGRDGKTVIVAYLYEDKYYVWDMYDEDDPE